MNHAQVLQPESLQEAQEALSQYGWDAKVLAGGTAVVIMLQQKLIAPQVLISLEKVPDLAYERSDSQGLHLGTMNRLRDVSWSGTVRKEYPGLAAACGEVGNVRVRNQATLGGNLAEADYASDPPAMLLALDAVFSTAGPGGSRSIPIRDFFQGFYTTALQEDELLIDILIPRLPANSRMLYMKYKSRSSEDRPCLGVAAVGTFQGEACLDLRVAIGAACEVPQRVESYEKLAVGKPLDQALISEIANGYAETIHTLEDLRGSAWYRTEMIRVFVSRALKQLVESQPQAKFSL
jgi:carbon-monoxide dehydrogenase medium subunit